MGVLAGLYLLWLGIWTVLGGTYGPSQLFWDQGAAAMAAALAAFFGARRVPRPYAGFLAAQGIAFVFLAASWVTNDSSSEPALAFSDLLSDAIYALCIFAMLCAWSYLASERWQVRPLSLLTVAIFTVLMFGLGAVFASFYHSQYASQLDAPLGRLHAVTAALEFAVLVAGLLCLLLRVPAVVIWMLVGTAILIAVDMTFSVDVSLRLNEAVWMFGQFLWLSAVVHMPMANSQDAPAAEPPSEPDERSNARSGLSGILILISLGAVLLSPLVWFLPGGADWKSFFSVLFIVGLVVVLVWITDRFDDTVAYLRNYVRRVHESRLVSEDWRIAPSRIRTLLLSTGLGPFLDEFRDSATRLRRNVLFLGPEPLYGPPRDQAAPRASSCFIVMPFGEQWSGDVHRILARACEAVGVRPVRGDDLFTPTDILEDIWQSIHAADFVIADITGRNPNVLYELGIAHTLAKPVLILSSKAADIPIDLATRRVIVYGHSGQDWREDLERKISAALATIVVDYALTGRR